MKESTLAKITRPFQTAKVFLGCQTGTSSIFANAFYAWRREGPYHFIQ